MNTCIDNSILLPMFKLSCGTAFRSMDDEYMVLFGEQSIMRVQ